MNVLMVCHSSPFPPESGATKRMYHLLQEASRRHTVSLIAIGTRGQSEEFIARAGVRCADVRFVEIARSKAERLWRLASGAAVGRSSAWSMHDPSVQQTIDALVARERFDLIHCTAGILGFYRFPPGTPSVADSQNVEHEVLLGNFRAAPLGPRKLFYAIDWRLFKRDELGGHARFDAVLTPSESDRRTFRSLLPELPAHVVPNGVDVDTFRPPPGGAEPFTMVFTGILNYFPNDHGLQFFLGKVFPEIRRREPRARIVIVGANASRRVRALAGPGVELTGRVDDVRPWMTRASVFVIPLLLGGGTRLKALEAMAMRIPIVSTTLGCQGIEFVNPDSVLIGDTPGAFAEQVVRLFRDPTLGRTLADRAHPTAAGPYAWSTVGDRLHAAYEAVIRGRHRASDRVTPPTPPPPFGGPRQ